jgi:hypothetical protein
LKGVQTDKIFDSSLFVTIRKRIGRTEFYLLNAKPIKRLSKEKDAQNISKKNDYESPPPPNKGKLYSDATVADQYITLMKLALYILLSTAMTFSSFKVSGQIDSIYDGRLGSTRYFKERNKVIYDNGADTHLSIDSVDQVGPLYIGAFICKKLNGIYIMYTYDLQRLNPRPEEKETLGDKFYRLTSVHWEQGYARAVDSKGNNILVNPNGKIRDEGPIPEFQGEIRGIRKIENLKLHF